jgi:hypothetical protein
MAGAASGTQEFDNLFLLQLRVGITGTTSSPELSSQIEIIEFTLTTSLSYDRQVKQLPADETIKELSN